MFHWSAQHGHSHDAVLLGGGAGLQAAARGFLLVLALSIHDLFEGVALGVARRQASVWFLLLAFASHKWVIAGCLGLKVPFIVVHSPYLSSLMCSK